MRWLLLFCLVALPVFGHDNPAPDIAWIRADPHYKTKGDVHCCANECSKAPKEAFHRTDAGWVVDYFNTRDDKQDQAFFPNDQFEQHGVFHSIDEDWWWCPYYWGEPKCIWVAPTDG